MATINFWRKSRARCLEVNKKGNAEFEQPIRARFQRYPLQKHLSSYGQLNWQISTPDNETIESKKLLYGWYFFWFFFSFYWYWIRPFWEASLQFASLKCINKFWTWKSIAPPYDKQESNRRFLKSFELFWYRSGIYVNIIIDQRTNEHDHRPY